MNNLAETISSSATTITAPEADGPITRRLLRRTMFFYLAICVLGLTPWLLHAPVFWQVTGIGLLWPGAGFLASGGWSVLLIPVTLVLFGLAVFAWFASAMVIAPPIIWLGAALLAGGLADETLWTPGPYMAIAVAVIWQIRSRIKKSAKIRAAVAKKQQRNAYLPAAISALPAHLSERPRPEDRELSVEQIAAMRYLFDRALQPIGQLEGFDHIEQFQPSALRYQLNQLGYALALAQCQYTPSFHGYLSQAQRNLIEQSLQEKIWKYWRYERLWGKFSLDDNPAGDDNIMLTGFLGLQVALYVGNTGDQRYSQPGSLGFLRDGKVIYSHDLNTIVDSLKRNFDAAPLCLYSCEPNWVYTFCNFRGMTALMTYDRIFKTRHAQQLLPRYLQRLGSEFTTQDGSLYAFKSNLTGLAVGSGNEAGSVLSFNLIDTKRAERDWAIARQEVIDFVDGKPKLKLSEKGIDFGNYKKSPVMELYQLLCAAREMGDDVVADATIEGLDTLCELNTENGQHFWKGSTMSVANAIMGFLMRRGDWRNTVLEGPPAEIFEGPILADAHYPEVLVAKARSDGKALELVLYPGKAAGMQTIKIERLTPHARYRMEGSQAGEFIADAAGSMPMQVMLEGRTAFTLSPMAL